MSKSRFLQGRRFRVWGLRVTVVAFRLLWLRV